MEFRWRVAEAKKEAELQKIYMLLGVYPLVLIIVALAIPYIGGGTAIAIYVAYLIYIIFRLQRVAQVSVN
jgi:hypothetical protein